MKMFRTARIPLSQLRQISKQRCAWKGCLQSCSLSGKLPPGWRWLSLWTGPVGVPPWAPGCIEDRDCVLCPKHAQLLHYELLTDIGQHLDETEGSA